MSPHYQNRSCLFPLILSRQWDDKLKTALSIFTVRKWSCGKVMFLQPVCQSFCSQGEVYTPHSLGKTPLWADTSLGKPPLPTPPRRSLQRTVRILLEYIIVIKHFNFEFILKRYPDVTNICQCIYLENELAKLPTERTWTVNVATYTNVTHLVPFLVKKVICRRIFS